jgi:hypothetical protein
MAGTANVGKKNEKPLIEWKCSDSEIRQTIDWLLETLDKELPEVVVCGELGPTLPAFSELSYRHVDPKMKEKAYWRSVENALSKKDFALKRWLGREYVIVIRNKNDGKEIRQRIDVPKCYFVLESIGIYKCPLNGLPCKPFIIDSKEVRTLYDLFPEDPKDIVEQLADKLKIKINDYFRKDVHYPRKDFVRNS